MDVRPVYTYFMTASCGRETSLYKFDEVLRDSCGHRTSFHLLQDSDRTVSGLLRVSGVQGPYTVVIHSSVTLEENRLQL